MLGISRHATSKFLQSKGLIAPITLTWAQKGSRSGSNGFYSTSADPDLLHTSVLPTDHFQKSLPRLAIPKLEKTCERYLTSQRVILSDEEYAATERIVKAFESNEGQQLQKQLVAHDAANKHTNYVSGPWFDMYLKDRRSVMLNHNPFIAFSHDPNPQQNNQLIRSTNFIVSSLRFMKTLRANVLEPEVFHLNPKKSDTPTFRRVVKVLPSSISWYGAYLFKAFPLDMSQYGRLFNSTRIPRFLPKSIAAYGAFAFKAFPLDMSQYGRLFCSSRIPRPERDELYTDANAKNVVVMRKGNFYSFDALDANGCVKPASEIMAHLQYILSDPAAPADHPIGYLSSQDRDFWTDARVKLVNAGNEDLLKMIDGAAFNLVLEDADSEEPITLSRMFLYGNGANRWFDKSFSVIMTPSGKAAVNFEHAWGDGVAVLRYFNEVYKDTTEKPQVNPDSKPASVDSSAAVKRLEFNLTPELKEIINTAKTNFAKTTATIDLNFLQYEKFGKNFLKQKKLSPDSFMQLLIQMAYYRQYGKTVATYESCSTAAFRHGRTETIRPATKATKKVCEMMSHSSKVSLAEIQAALAECSTLHGELTKNAAMGQGFDRHMFGLRHTAAENGETPEIFRDPSYAKINHNILSTSTLSSPAVIIGGFAPVVPDGYGVGYAIENEQLGFAVTSYPPATNVHDFLQCAQDSVNDLYKVLNGQDFRS